MPFSRLSPSSFLFLSLPLPYNLVSSNLALMSISYISHALPQSPFFPSIPIPPHHIPSPSTPTYQITTFSFSNPSPIIFSLSPIPPSSPPPPFYPFLPHALPVPRSSVTCILSI